MEQLVILIIKSITNGMHCQCRTYFLFFFCLAFT